MNKILLIIGTVFPEPNTTAAGVRLLQLIDFFQEKDYSIQLVSTAQKGKFSESLEKRNISTTQIKLNDNSFDNYLKEVNPSIVLFDRFITEEQFGWRVEENCPNALKILDTEDLQFLRKAREKASKKNKNEINLFSEIAKREIASIYRCDLSLIISKFEMELLKKTFKVPTSILHYIPFLHSENIKSTSFEERKDYFTIGNFLHQPNVTAVELLYEEIWPVILNEIPNATLHIYGNYAPQRILQLHNPSKNFLIKGWAENKKDTFLKHRILLAPIQYGAGLKGKLFDALQTGTPAITTQIGAEGMYGKLPKPVIVSSIEEFAEAAITIYTNKEKWNNLQKNCLSILQERFKREKFVKNLSDKITSIENDLQQHRKENFMGSILKHQSMQSTKYLSKWIEEKNKSKL